MRRLATLFGFLVASAASAASAAGVLVALFEGEQPGDGFGGVIATPGDLDGDGVDDLLLGAEDFVSVAPPSVGRIYAIRGGAWTPLYTVDGPETVQRFGSAIAGVGDVDGDLRPDFVAGLRGFAQPGGQSTGRVILYSGATGQEILVIDPPADGVGWFGASVGGAGDTNEDGVPDIVVGAPSGCSGGEFFYICAPGDLYLLSGADGAVILSWNGDQFDRLRLGVAAAGAGDVDADGRGDVIAGAITTYLSGWTVSQGYAYVLSGATGETLYERHSGFPLGFPAVPSYSPRVGSPGDLDGDGHDDFFTRIATGATVWSGATGEALAGSPTWSRAETGIPDTDGDGLPDLAFGRNNFDDTRNTEIFSGATSSWLGAIVGPEDSTFSYELGGLRAASGETLILTGQPSSEDDPIGRVYVHAFRGACTDFDGDGYGPPLSAPECGFAGVDCDDYDAAVGGGPEEVCNGVNDDCDAEVDEGFEDADGDGAAFCVDCDDEDSFRYPGAFEVCDGVDQDCTGVADDGPDPDGDGFAACDCRPSDPIVYPGAPELCDSRDQDCDGDPDGPDADGDGDGVACDCDDADPARETLDRDGDGYTTCDGDCNDDNPFVNPGAAEFPFNGIDENCDGEVCGSLPREGRGEAAGAVLLYAAALAGFLARARRRTPGRE